MSPTISIIRASSPPLSPTTPLNPHAKSWIPELEAEKISAKAKKTASIMYPQAFFTTPSPQPPHCPQILTHSPVPVIYQQHFQHFHVQPQPLAIPSLHYCGIFHCNEAVFWCYNFGGQPPLPQPEPAVLPLTSWSFTAHYEVEGEDLKKGIDGSGAEEKRDSRVSFGDEDLKKNTKRFVPPRFRKGWSLEMQGRRKTWNWRQQIWKPKKAKSDLGVVVAASDDGVVAMSSSAPRPSTRSPVEDFPHCKNTTVMIRNIPNTYRYTLLI